jgi:hypothetical protein
MFDCGCFTSYGQFQASIVSLGANIEKLGEETPNGSEVLYDAKLTFLLLIAQD